MVTDILLWNLQYNFVSSETESAKGEEAAKEEKDEVSVEEGEMMNNNTKKSVSERWELRLVWPESVETFVVVRMTRIFSAVKSRVGGRREKYSEGGESEVKLPVSID